MIAGIKSFKKYYDEGVLPKDFFTDKTFDGNKTFTSGQAGLFCSSISIGGIQGIMNKFEKGTGTPVEGKVGILIQVNEKGEALKHQVFPEWSEKLFSAKMSDEKFDRLLSFMDYLTGTEGQNTITYGIKGIDWSEINGKPVLHWKKDTSDGAPAWKLVNPFPNAGAWQGFAGITDNENNSLINPGYRPDAKDLWKKFYTKYATVPGRNAPYDFK